MNNKPTPEQLATWRESFESRFNIDQLTRHGQGYKLELVTAMFSGYIVAMSQQDAEIERLTRELAALRQGLLRTATEAQKTILTAKDTQ